MNIVVLDGHGLNPGDLSWEGLKAWGDLTVYPRTEPALVYERAREADVLLTNKTPLDAAVLERLPQLKYIGVLATGYNVVDTEAARQLGITVCNIPAYSTASVAQTVFAHLLTIVNRTEHYTEQIRHGSWSACPDFCYWDTPLTELAGKKMGIVGLGHIGQAVARIAGAFGMEVLAVTSKPAEQLAPTGIGKRTLRELLAESDVVSLHCPLTPDTHHLINADTLRGMKPGAILINTGRGPLVDETAVAEALNNGRLAAYGADVLSVEPPALDHPLLSARHAFLTPHIAWATREARERLLSICLENIRAFVEGHPQNVVNL